MHVRSPAPLPGEFRSTSVVARSLVLFVQLVDRAEKQTRDPCAAGQLLDRDSSRSAPKL
jgi:hypothetical protein